MHHSSKMIKNIAENTSGPRMHSTRSTTEPIDCSETGI